MQWLRPITRYLLMAALAMMGAVVFSGPFSVAYPEVALAQGTTPSVNAPAMGPTAFLVMTVMLVITILIMFKFSRVFRESPPH